MGSGNLQKCGFKGYFPMFLCENRPLVKTSQKVGAHKSSIFRTHRVFKFHYWPLKAQIKTPHKPFPFKDRAMSTSWNVSHFLSYGHASCWLSARLQVTLFSTLVYLSSLFLLSFWALPGSHPSPYRCLLDVHAQGRDVSGETSAPLVVLLPNTFGDNTGLPGRRPP